MGKRRKTYSGAAEYSACSAFTVVIGAGILLLLFFYYKSGVHSEKMTPAERHAEALRLKAISPYYIGKPSQKISCVHVLPSGGSVSLLNSAFYEISKRGAAHAVNKYVETHDSPTIKEIFYISTARMFRESFFSTLSEKDESLFDVGTFLVDKGVDEASIYTENSISAGKDILSMVFGIRNFVEGDIVVDIPCCIL
jgi:hypothetical protein